MKKNILVCALAFSFSSAAMADFPVVEPLNPGFQGWLGASLILESNILETTPNTVGSFEFDGQEGWGLGNAASGAPVWFGQNYGGQGNYIEIAVQGEGEYSSGPAQANDPQINVLVNAWANSEHGHTLGSSNPEDPDYCATCDRDYASTSAVGGVQMEAFVQNGGTITSLTPTQVDIEVGAWR